MRIFAIAVVACCAAVSPASAQVNPFRSAAASSPLFQPRLVPDVAPAPLLYQRQKPDARVGRRTHGAAAPQHTPYQKPSHDTETVCGTKMIRPTHDVDHQIRIHADLGQGIRARRIEPDACGAPRR